MADGEKVWENGNKITLIFFLLHIPFVCCCFERNAQVDTTNAMEISRTNAKALGNDNSKPERLNDATCENDRNCMAICAQTCSRKTHETTEMLANDFPSHTTKMCMWSWRERQKNSSSFLAGIYENWNMKFP